MLNMRIILSLLMLCGYCMLGFGQAKRVAIASPAADALHPVLQSVCNVGFPPSGDVGLMLGPHIVACYDYHRQKFAVLDRQTGASITPVFAAMDSIYAVNLAAARALKIDLSLDAMIQAGLFGQSKEAVANQRDTLHLLMGVSYETLEVYKHSTADTAPVVDLTGRQLGDSLIQMSDSALYMHTDMFVVRWAPGQAVQWAKLNEAQPQVDSLSHSIMDFTPLPNNGYAFATEVDTLRTGPMPFLIRTTAQWATHGTTPFHGANHRLPAHTRFRTKYLSCWGRYQNGGLLINDPHRYYPDGNFSGVGPIALPEGYRQNALQAITPHGQNHLGVYWGDSSTVVHVALFSPDCTTRLAATTLPERPDQRTDDALQPVAAAIDASNVAVLWNDGQVYVYSLHDAPKPASPGKKRKGASDKHS